MPGFGVYYDNLIKLLPIATDAKIIVETGLSEGDSTYTFLESLSMMDGDRELHTFEIDDEKPQCLRGKDRIIKSNFKAKWFLHVMDSKKGGRQWNKDKKIDVLFLDSDHGTEHVYGELEAWVPNLSSNSIILSDDVYTNGKPDTAYFAFQRWHDKYSEWKFFAFHEDRGMGVLFK